MKASVIILLTSLEKTLRSLNKTLKKLPEDAKLASLETSLKALNKTLKGLPEEAKKATELLALVHSEMTYMRELTQQAAQGIAQEAEVTPPAATPPLGRAGTMPPAFPTRAWETYPIAPDAKLEDTDNSLLEQTEQEVMDAQGREELRAKGIEPELEDEEQPAVMEEA